MKSNLIGAYPLCITISLELIDDLCRLIKSTEVKNFGDNRALASDILSKYPRDIKDIMFTREIRA